MGISALNNLRFFIFEFLLITHCYFVLCSDRQLWLLWFWFWFCNTHGKDDNTDKSQVWRIWGPNQRSTFLRVILLIPDCTSFTFLCFVIGPENSRCSLNQSNEKIKTIATLSFAFSRALSGFLVYTLSSHWLYRVLSFLMIGSIGCSPFLWLALSGTLLSYDWLYWVLSFLMIGSIGYSPFLWLALSGTLLSYDWLYRVLSILTIGCCNYFDFVSRQSIEMYSNITR